MLQLTSRAAATPADTRSRSGLPENFGVRIFSSATPDTTSPFQFDFVPGPEEGDQVSETEGTRVFVAAEAAERLADTVLDAEESDQEPRLILTRRV